MKYYEYLFSGSYDSTCCDYDEYGNSYGHGSEGEISGEIHLFAGSAEDAEREVLEMIGDRVGGEVSIDLDGGEVTGLDPEEMEELFYVNY